MGKRKCKINSKTVQEFPFIRGHDENAECTICGAKFSIGHGGRTDIVTHMKSNKHKVALQVKSSSSKMDNYLSVKAVSDMDKQLSAQEATFAYHTVMHNQSFKSMDCTSDIIKSLFNNKFACSQTKTRAIITNVIAPFAVEQIMKELKEAQFISVMIDSSSHTDLKLVPVMVRFYHPGKGIVVRLLEMVNFGVESSEHLTSYVLEVLEKFDLKKKVVAISADNTNTNYGGKKRKGKNNLYFKLQEKSENNLIGIGCPAHIVHNAVQTAADGLPIDIQLIIGKIYQHFHIYAARVEKLKSFCEFVQVEYKKLLGHCKTRWLSLLPAIERVLDVFPALKSYFLSLDKCPITLKNFFENPLSFITLQFLSGQLRIFSNCILFIETESVTIIEVADKINILLNKLEARKSERFLTSAIQQLLHELESDGLVTSDQFNNIVTDFYDTCISYIREWCEPFLVPLQPMEWIALNKTISWISVQELYTFVKSSVRDFTADEGELFDEYCCVSKYCEGKLLDWNINPNISVSEKWQEIFTHFHNERVCLKHLRSLVEFSLAIPGSNASIERVFSVIKAFWTDEKNSLKLETVKALTLIKTTFVSLPCMGFYNLIIKENKLLEQIHTTKKYSSGASECVASSSSSSMSH